jgi:hypothetical protein
MSVINSDDLRRWELMICDTLSSKLEVNIKLTNQPPKEMVYQAFLPNERHCYWGTLCESKNHPSPVIIAIDYTSIRACTSVFFSHIVDLESGSKEANLSFSERFIAKEITHDIATLFSESKSPLKIIKNENTLNLIHPFHDDDPIIVYEYDIKINDVMYGRLTLCHSHIL